MEDRVINRVELEEAEARGNNHEKNRVVFAMGTITERISGLVNLFVSVFRNDWFVDFQQKSYKRDAANPSKIYHIDIKNKFSVYIKNTGTGRIRLFNDLWLAPNGVFSDENQHYRKYFRSIELLLADNINDAEGYLIKDSAGLLTHSCIVITKQVTSQP